MDNYRCHKEYIPKIRAEHISDIVDLFTKKNSMPNMSSIDSTIHDAQDLINALKNTAPDRPLVTLVNSHN